MNYVIEFSHDCRIRGLTKHTIESYRSNVLDFVRQINVDPENVTMDELRAHLEVLQDREYGASTYNSYYAALNTFYDFLVFEGVVNKNPIPAFRQRYLNHVVKMGIRESRQIITVEDMRHLVALTDDIENRAMLMMLAKTGIRRGEFMDLKIKDLNLDQGTIQISHKAKRRRDLVFMDQELHNILAEYLVWRESRACCDWLWISSRGGRVHKDHAGKVIAMLGERVGLHDPDGPLCERLTPHCFRHWFTTHLYRAGMDPEYIKWLRGDSLQKEAWQIYNHIDPEIVREDYIRCIPKIIQNKITR